MGRIKVTKLTAIMHPVALAKKAAKARRPLLVLD